MQYSIVYFSEAKKEKRFDAEFYHPEYLILINKIIECEHSVLSVYIDEITDGKHGGVTFVDSGITFIRNTNNKEGYIELSDIHYITKEENEENKRSKLKYRDVLLTTIGTIGESSVVEKEFEGSNINQNLVRIKINTLNPYYLSTFFNSYFGRRQILALSNGNVQPMINYTSINKIKVPIFSDEFQKSIEQLVLEAHHQRQISNSLMKEANEILEKEIGFDKLEIKKKKVNYSIVNYSETLLSKRIDAEYYQEKYKIIMDKIQSYKNGYIKIIDLNSVNNKLVSIDKNKKYEYIELSNIDSMGFINNLELYYGYELPSRARRLLNNNDVIISSVEGSLDKSSLIYSNKNNLLCSTGFLVFNENESINPETLFCFFRLTLIKELLKKITKGTILTAFDSNAICDMEIPNLDKNVQNVIAEKVQDSYNARDKAKALLEEAKKKVEDAIENGER